MPDTHTVEVHIPADLAARLGGPGPEPDRRALEALALAAYQAGELTGFELRDVLGLGTRQALDDFLAARGVDKPLTLDEVRHDIAELRGFRG